MPTNPPYYLDPYVPGGSPPGGAGPSQLPPEQVRPWYDPNGQYGNLYWNNNPGGGGSAGGGGASGGGGGGGAGLTGNSTGFGPSSLGLTGAGGTGAGAGTGAGMAAAGGSWYTNPQLWGTVLGAAGSYFGAQDANAAAAQANAPRPYSNQTTPWGPAEGNLTYGMQELMNRYQNQPNVPGAGGRGGGAGGGIPNISNPMSSDMQGLLASMTARGMNIPDYLQSGQASSANIAAGNGMGNNPYLEGTYGAASGYQNPYTDQFVQAMMGGFLPGGSGSSGSGGRSNSSIIASGGGAHSTYHPNQYLTASLNGDWLNANNPYLQSMIDSTAGDLRQQYLQELAPSVDAQFQRAGRYGSDAYQQAQVGAAQQFQRSLSGMESQMNTQEYEAERARMQDSLGLLQSGENQSMQSNAQLGSASIGANASMYGSQLQSDTANRGLLLNAIQGQSADDLARMGLMGNMAGLYGDSQSANLNAQVGALNAMPGLEQASWMGPQNAWGANMDSAGINMQVQQANQQAAQARAAARNQQWNMQQQQDTARFHDLMNYSLSAGQAFGQQSGVSSPNQYIPQVNPWAAGIQGGLGGYMMGSGMQQQG